MIDSSELGPSVHVLLVDGDEDDAKLTRTALDECTAASFETTHASGLAEALRALSGRNVQVVLLDLDLPQLRGIEALSKLRQHAPQTPVVVLTRREDDDLALQVVRAGAHSLLLKHEANASLLGRTLLHAMAQQNAQAEAQAQRNKPLDQATHDPLTGLPNEVLFQDRLHQAMAYAARTGQKLAVLMIGLDRFKRINDTLGQHVGDEMLRFVAQRVSRCVRQSDSGARIGGDQFAILITNLAREVDAARVAEKILELLFQPFSLDQTSYYAPASIGIAIHPRDGAEATELLKASETAMLHAKEIGGNLYAFFTEDLNTAALDRLTLERQLRTALDRDEFSLHYQPIFDVQRNQIVGAEALIRWEHPKRGRVSPADFLPIAEETRQIIPIGEWVVRTACEQCAAWNPPGSPPVSMSINISPQQLRQPGFVEMVRRILRQTGAQPNLVELEITESSFLHTAETTKTTLNELRELGIQLVLDDFGTGYSAMAYLKELPFDVLKIDQAFVREMKRGSKDEGIVTAILALAEALDLRTVAEGVETQEQLDLLTARGCAYMQGYFLGRPGPAADLTEKLAASSVACGARPA